MDQHSFHIQQQLQYKIQPSTCQRLVIPQQRSDIIDHMVRYTVKQINNNHDKGYEAFNILLRAKEYFQIPK